MPEHDPAPAPPGAETGLNFVPIVSRAPQPVHPLYDEAAALLHLTALFGHLPDTSEEFVAFAIGGELDPATNKRRWSEQQFLVSGGFGVMLEWAGYHVGLRHDVHIAYHPRSQAGRKKTDSAAVGRTLWIDGDDAMRTDAVQRVKEAGGWAVASGSLGHFHLGLTLDEDVSVEDIELRNKQLRDALGGDDKQSSESLLRLAGTRNYKSGGDGNPVEFVIRPTTRVTSESYQRLLTGAKDRRPTRASVVKGARPGKAAAVKKFDRSAFAYADIALLVEQGEDDNAIVAAIRTDAFGDSARDHYRDESHMREDIDRVRSKLAAAAAEVQAVLASVGFDPNEAVERSQQGVSRRFVQTLSGKAHYVPELGCWFVWTGRQWAEDVLGEVTARLMDYNDASYTLSTTTSQWVRDVRKASTINGVMALTRVDRAVALSQARLDSEPNVLNTPNGLVDLKTGDLLPHDPSMLVTKSTAVPFVTDRTQPIRFLAFLDETFAGQPVEMREYLLDALGYALNGAVTEHLLLILHGLGANGKTTLVEVLYGILGDYAMPAPATLLIADSHSHHPTEVADLKGARLVVVQETEESAQFAEAKVKQLTGGDELKARFMRQDFFSFRPSHTMLLVTNHKPQVKSGGLSFWRRARLLPFTNTVPEHRMDPHLAETLVREEGSAILGLLVERARRYYVDGLHTPPAVKHATDNYRGENDPLHAWSTGCLEVRDGLKVQEADLWECYRWWCTAEDISLATSKEWRKYLREELRLTGRRSNNLWTWAGVRVRADAPTRPTFAEALERADMDEGSHFSQRETHEALSSDYTLDAFQL